MGVSGSTSCLMSCFSC